MASFDLNRGIFFEICNKAPPILSLTCGGKTDLISALTNPGM
jgi:hypothetical protein